MNKKIKTYAESEGEKPFDWNKFLNKKKYKENELKNAFDLSINWVTYTCGNQYSIIPHNKYKKPKDIKLKELGEDFACNIGSMLCSSSPYYFDEDDIELHRKKAKKTLAKIEKRSVCLLEKELKKRAKEA